ncbi:hypothetical protein GOODEAATRI_030233, partial [Goodea atripinnis]
MLIKMGATILCGPDGLSVHLPNGTQLACGNNSRLSHGQYLIQPLADPMADIYWALLHPETRAGGGILSSFLQWKSWILTLAPYVSPLTHHMSPSSMTGIT